MDTDFYKCWPLRDAMLADRSGGHAPSSRTLASDPDPSSVAAMEVAMSTTINAIFYDGAYYGGAELYMEAASGCDNNDDIDWSWSALRSDWKNRITSGRGFSNCDFKFFDFDNFQGAASQWYAFTGPSIGALNNAANSVKMR